MTAFGKRLPRLIAIDLDGTLLDGRARAPARARSALHRVREAGVALVVVTGRPARGVRRLAAPLGIGGTAICANGAETYDLDTGTLVDARPLDARQARRLVRAVRASVPGTAFAWEDHSGFGHDRAWNRAPLPPVERVPVPPFEELPNTVGDPEELLAGPLLKLLVRHPELAGDALAGRARAAVAGAATVTWSSPEIVELLSPAAGKRAALSRLCARRGIDPGEVVAIGDGENDRAMLAWAGWGVAMAGAAPGVVAAADEVARGGVAAVLERLSAPDRSPRHLNRA